MKLRRLVDNKDHVRLQDFLGRDVPGYLIHDDIYVDITDIESRRLSQRNVRHPYDRIDLRHPINIQL